MRRSKARDLADIELPEPPIDMEEFPFQVLWTPQVGADRTPISMDFEFLRPLGDFGKALLKELLVQVRDETRPTTSNIYYLVLPYLKKLALQASTSPTTWSRDRWKVFTDSHILEVRRRGDIEATTKRDIQYKITKFLRSASKRNVIPSFKVIPPARNISGGKKLSIGSVEASGDLGEIADLSLRELADRLRDLTNVNDPEVHQERTSILLQILADFMSDEARRYWRLIQETEGYLADPDGIDVDAFLAEKRISVNPVRFKKGWPRKIKSERDAVRFCAHPDVFPLLLNTSSSTNQVKLWLTRRPGGLTRMRERLHSTPESILPFLVLLLLDLNNEVSSVQKILEDCAQFVEGEKKALIRWLKGRSHEVQEDWRDVGSPDALRPGSREQITSFQAVQCVLKMRERLVPFAPEQSKRYLFLVSYACDNWRRIANVISSEILLKAWDAALNRHPVLRLYRFTLDRIRGSIVLREFLATGSIVSTAQKARHNDMGTTQRYVAETAGIMMGHQSVREVQDLLILNSVRKNHGLIDHLGITKARAVAIAEKAYASCFGAWQLPGAPAVPADVPIEDSPFVKWMLGAEHLWIESANVAAEIVAFREHLLREADAVRGTQAWYDYWAPMLLMLGVALEIMRVDIRMAGEELAKEYQIEYMEIAA